jgi:hypothetical protein
MNNTMEMKRYILVAGDPFRGYTGTLTFTGLLVVGSADTVDEAKALTEDSYEKHGGLLLWIDRETGKPGEPGDDESLKFGSLSAFRKEAH